MIGEIMKNKIFTITKLIVVISIFLSIKYTNITTIFTLLFTLILLFLADYLKKKLNYTYKLQTLIYIFILSAQLGGVLLNLYDKTNHYDDIIHTLSSFLSAALSLTILNKLTTNPNKKLKIIFAISLSLSIAAIWEITEFTIDRVLNKDMQKDTIITTITSSKLSSNNNIEKKEITSLYVNNIDFVAKYGGYIDIGLYDTMEDIICALIGSLLYILKILKHP